MDGNGSTALRERQANGNAGAEAASSQPAKKPTSPKKSGKAAGKPSGKAGAKTSGRVRCHAWSAAVLMISMMQIAAGMSVSPDQHSMLVQGKADPNQRGIMAFFNSK